MIRKTIYLLLMSMAIVAAFSLTTSCGESEVEATVRGYVLSDTIYQLGVENVQVVLTILNVEDMPNYETFTDSTGFYSITFETGYTEDEEGRFLPNEVVEISLTYYYGTGSFNISGIQIRRGQVYTVRPVYLSEITGGGGGGGRGGR